MILSPRAAHGYLEIERKRDRPYFVLIAEIDGVTWGLPFRSSIKHSHAFWTNKEEGCGIDYSKAVAIESAADIDREKMPPTFVIVSSKR